MKQILTPSRATEMIDNGKFGRELSLMLAKAGKFGLKVYYDSSTEVFELVHQKTRMSSGDVKASRATAYAAMRVLDVLLKAAAASEGTQGKSVEALRKRAVAIGNNLRPDGDNTMLYIRNRRDHGGHTYLARNALDKTHPHSNNSWKFKLPQELDLLTQFIEHDVGLYKEWHLEMPNAV